MSSSPTVPSPSNLSAVILPNPATIAPTTPVGEVIALLRTGNTVHSLTDDRAATTSHSCVLVLEGNRLTGIVTVRDLIRLSAYEHHGAGVAIAEVMTTPVLTLNRSEFTNLFFPLHLCQQHSIHHLPVVDDQGNLIGLLTQERLHHALQQVLLPQYTQMMQEQAAREQVLAQITTQIHASLPLQEVLDGTVATVREFLQCDRLLVCQIQPDGDGLVVAESVGAGWRAALHDTINDLHFRKQETEPDRDDTGVAVDNVHTAGYPACYLYLLEQYQVKSNLVIPIRLSGTLWGVLIGHQCAAYRSWHRTEVVLLYEIGVQLAIAIQQAITQQQWQQELEARQQAELALLESEAELKSLFAAMEDDVVLVLDRQGTYLKIPSTQSNRLYRPREELLGRSLHDFFSTEQANFFLNCIRQTLETQHTQECEYPLLIGEAERWFNTRCYPLTSETVLWVARDISERNRIEDERKQAEQELQQQQALLRTIIDTNPNKIFIKDREGIFLLANQAIAEAYHTAVDDLIGKKDSHWYPDATRMAQFLEENQRVIDYQQPLFIPEEKGVSIDGHEQWWQWQKYPILLPGKSVPAVLGVGVEITRHKEAEVTLHQYERVVSATVDKIALLDRHYIYRLVNQVYLDWHGKQRDEIIGHSVADLLGETVFQTQVQPRLDRCLAGEVQQNETWWDYEKGGSRFVRVTYSPYIEEDGSIGGVVVSVHDLTAIKQAETSLELQNTILERIARNEPLAEILDTLIRAVEHQLEGAIGSMMLCDRDGLLFQGPAPHLPIFYRQVLDSLTSQTAGIGEGIGSCGTAAVRRETVITSDIATDPLWHSCRDLALAYGLRACWAVPILSKEGEPLGVFGVYYQDPRTPHPHELEILFRAANIAGIAIERERATQALEQLNRELEDRIEERTLALQTSENRYRQIVETQTEFVLRSRPDTTITFANTAICHAFGRSPDQMMGLCWSEFVPPNDFLVLERKIATLSPDHPRFENTNADYRANGQLGWTQWVNLGLFNEQGELLEIQSVGRDVTQLHRIEDALRQSEERFRNAFENTAVGMSLVAPEGNFLKVNPALCQFLGYDENELLERRFQDISYSDDDLSINLEFIHSLLAGERDSFHLEQRFSTKQSQVVWGLLSVSLIRDVHGRPLYFVSQIQDISDRKRAEQENQQLRERLQFILASNPAVIFICKPEGDYGATFISDNITEVMGYTSEEFLTDSGFWANHIHPDDAPRVFAGLPRLFEKNHHVHEYRFQHQRGHYLWVRNELRLLRDEQGSPVEIVGYFADISDRKRLEQTQQRLITILEASTDYIGMSDVRTGKVIWNNAAIKQLCGIESDTAVVQRRPADYHPQWAWERLEQEALPVAIATGSWLGETALLDAKGQEIPVSELLLAHKSPQGEVEFFSAIMRDMRVHKEYEQRLERTNAELLNATRLKDEFLTNMSHELRTPLNAILGMSENLLEEVLGAVNERQKKAIATIVESGQHLLTLINDILDVSKISAGQFKLDCAMVSVTHLCTSSLTFVKQQALKKQIQLNAFLPPDLGAIEVDERRMRQVLINLLTNAVKFTPAGGQVTLEARLVAGDGHHRAASRAESVSLECPPDSSDRLEAVTSIAFSVIDTGIGIAPDQQTKLFQPFVQVDSSLNRHYEGTGLGLALVKQIVELHGGFVALTSELGQGSCFTVYLPSYLPSYSPVEEIVLHPTLPQDNREQLSTRWETTEPEREPCTKENALILLAEDNQDNINTFSSYLEVYGYRMMIARNGREAIDLAQTQCPDLILMDIQMPEVNGLEAIRVIRQDPQLAPIPIIALTALAMKGDRERCLAAGANEYAAKPVQLKQLVSMMRQLLGRKGVAR